LNIEKERETVKQFSFYFYFTETDTTDNLEDRIRTLFGNAKKLKTPERDAEYESIRKDYMKVLDDAGN